MEWFIFAFHKYSTHFPLGSGKPHLDSALTPVAGVAASCLPVGMVCVAKRVEMCGVVGFEEGWTGGSGVIGL